MYWNDPLLFASNKNSIPLLLGILLLQLLVRFSLFIAKKGTVDTMKGLIGTRAQNNIEAIINTEEDLYNKVVERK